MLKKLILGIKSPLFIILLIAGLVLSFNINKPFWGHHDWNGVYWGAVARNYVRYGLLETKFAMVGGNGVLALDQLGYNFHYAPLFPLIWAGFLKVFGFFEWSGRLMSAMFSLGSLSVFYLLIKKYFDLKTSVLACLFWIVTPMFVYFGKMPVHEIPLMFFVLLAFYSYLSKKFSWLMVSTVLACLITWPGYFIVPAISLHWVVFKKIRTVSAKHLLVLWLTCFALFILFLLHDRLVTGSFVGGGVKEIFLSRISSVEIIPYILILLRWAWTYYFLLLPLAILAFIRDRKRIDILILFLAYAVIYPIVFRDASIRHDYLLIYFWPFLALASARVIKNLSLGLIIAIIIFVVRLQYTNALQKSDLYRICVEVGKKIASLTKPSDRVLVISKDPNAPLDAWFVGYYSDRIASVIYEGTPITENYDKVFYYLPDGSIKPGDEIRSNGIKYIPQ